MLNGQGNISMRRNLFYELLYLLKVLYQQGVNYWYYYNVCVLHAMQFFERITFGEDSGVMRCTFFPQERSNIFLLALGWQL